MDGFSIELWSKLAQDLHLDFELRETDLKGLIAGVKDSTFDVGIAAISVTPEREQSMDFCHPYYYSGLGIAVLATPETNWVDVLKQFMSWDLLKVVGALTGSILLFGTIIWLLERRRNPQQFGGHWQDGLGSGVWWSAVTLTTVGYGDKTPVTLWGRLFALVWMVSAIIIVSSFTATMTTALTVRQLESAIKGPDDLGRFRVAVVTGTTGENYITARGISPRGYKTPLEGLKDLSAGRVDAVVYDAPILQYLARQNFPSTISVLPNMFERQYYGIALPAGSPLRKQLNQALLKRLQGQEWQDIVKRYLGDG